MAKANKLTDAEQVAELIAKLENPLAEMVRALRQIILDTDAEIAEQVKWNSPSFYYSGEMKPFDPKEYKRDIVVMNLRKGVVLLIFPTGARINNTTGILEGDYTDGRRMVKFQRIDEIHAKKTQLKTVLLEWLRTVEKE